MAATGLPGAPSAPSARGRAARFAARANDNPNTIAKMSSTTKTMIAATMPLREREAS